MHLYSKHTTFTVTQATCKGGGLFKFRFNLGSIMLSCASSLNRLFPSHDELLKFQPELATRKLLGALILAFFWYCSIPVRVDPPRCCLSFLF